MKDYTVYTKIQQLKELGFKPSNVAAQLGIHRNTVKKYWNMDADNFQEAVRVINRIKLLTDYQGIILKWLTEHPCFCVFRNIRTANPETSGHETGSIRTLCRLN